MNLLKEYDSYILKNAAQISSIESALRTITYILPSRFKDAEIASETLYTTLNLVGLYHDSLLAKAVANLPPSVRKPEPSPHNRYTQFWTKASPSYKRLALAIVVIQHAEVLLEMGAKKKWGDKGRWRTVIAIEALKVICRFGLLSLTKARPLVSPPLPAREIDPHALEELSASPHPTPLPSDFPSPTLSSTSSSLSSLEDPNHPYMLPRTGTTLPSLSSTTSSSPFNPNDGITSYLFSRVLTVEDIKPAAQLLPRLNGLSWYAEILYILRPLIYALLLQRWVRTRGERNARRSWWPWLVGLSIEYAALELRKRDNSLRLGRLEKEEQNRRNKALWWWVLRGAMYENVSKDIIDGFVQRIERVPLLNIAGGIISDYQYLWENYYFSSISSSHTTYLTVAASM